MRLHRGDLLRVLPTLKPDSIDACVTDPPYGIGFMGKQWDGTGVAFDVATWQAVYRVLKPGAYLVAFGGTRTSHRMVCAIEDAGFQIRDSITWLYGTGFPKSLNLGQGRGTALKPASEPIVLAWKPFTGTITANVKRHGTGALNIDACRIGKTVDTWPTSAKYSRFDPGSPAKVSAQPTGPAPPGRWPANVLLDEDAAARLDAQAGVLKSGGTPFTRAGLGYSGKAYGQTIVAGNNGDRGGASRFFYCAKPSRKERDAGCGDLALRTGAAISHRKPKSAGLQHPGAGIGAGSLARAVKARSARNTHPTVKPVSLLRYLVRLVTPIGGTVLDCFAGSGTTGMACKAEQRPCVLIEQEAAYLPIIRARVTAALPRPHTPPVSAPAVRLSVNPPRVPRRV